MIKLVFCFPALSELSLLLLDLSPSQSSFHMIHVQTDDQQPPRFEMSCVS